MALFDDTRSAWGARKATSVKPVSITTRTEFFTHWAGQSAGLFGKPHSACLEQVKRWQTQHMDVQGWSDIGYNGLICVHALSIEGRGRDYAGAHCPDHNTSGIGWQFMVGKGETITDAMFSRMRRVYDECSTASGKALAKRTHSDGFATECGGDQCRTWTHAGMPVASTTPTTPPPAPAPTPAPKPPTPAPAPKGLNVKIIDLRDVSPYVTGPGVKPLQRLLGVPADGLAGAGTRAALGRAQVRIFGKADYLFGPATAEALLAGK